MTEDDVDLADTLAEALRSDGFVVDVAYDGRQALARLGEIDVDVLILDRDLPGVSGDVVCRELRELNDPTRILMLTAAGSLMDRVTGLDLGADDYLPKPFAYVELLARVRALSRRARPICAPVLSRGNLRVDTIRRQAVLGGEPLRLSPKELEVLETLLLADGQPLSVERLLDIAWDAPDDLTRGVVKVVVHSLRKKLGAGWIVNDPGFGYRLEAP